MFFQPPFMKYSPFYPGQYYLISVRGCVWWWFFGLFIFLPQSVKQGAVQVMTIRVKLILAF